MMLYFITFGIALFFSGFFSGVETGIIRIDPVDVNNLAARSSKKEKSLLAKLITLKEELIAMSLIGTNLSVAIASAVVTSFLFNTFDLKEKGSLIATLVVTPLILFFGEVLPKTFFLHNSLSKINHLTPIIALFRMIFFPLIKIISFFTNIIKKLPPQKILSTMFISRDDLELLIALTEAKDSTAKKEQMYLSRLLRFHAIQAKEIMKPLIDIKALPETSSFREIAQLIKTSGYSRIPVYKEHIDNITGIIHAKDILFGPKTKTLDLSIPHSIIRNIKVVPETKKIEEIFTEFQKKHIYAAIVIDEYGAAVGLITIEDILEEIFGEIYDEYDMHIENEIYPIGKNLYYLSGRLDIDEFNVKFNSKIIKKNFETLAGFIMSLGGRVPKQGELFQYRNFSFTILKANEQRIDTIKLKILESDLE